MIFPDTPIDIWCEKHDLEIIHDKCPNCRSKMSTTRPFIEKQFIGLISPRCNCGYDAGLSVQIIRYGFDNIIAHAEGADHDF